MKRYLEVARALRQLLHAGALKPGERAPSVRQMKEQTGYSAMTIQRAYALLESEGLLVARPRSGFFVNAARPQAAQFPAARVPRTVVEPKPLSTTLRLYRSLAAAGPTSGSRLVDVSISEDLLPAETLRALLQRALRHKTPFEEQIEGNPSLREFVARRCIQRGLAVAPDDVAILGNISYALQACLRVMTRPGSIVMVESPSYFPLFGALARSDLRALEIYSHPATGIDPQQFAHLLSRNEVSVCILSPTYHFPTGTASSAANMEKIVSYATRFKVPIIEVDAYGELGYDDPYPPSLKMFDTEDLIVQIGSFAETLGRRFGLAWMVGRRFQREILETVFFDNPFGIDGVVQEAISNYFRSHSYDRHLRRVRETLSARMDAGRRLSERMLPSLSSISIAQGGFMCWVRLPPSVNALDAARSASGEELIGLPGSIFSVSGSFRNFLGLNFSHPWSDATEAAIAAIARRAA